MVSKRESISFRGVLRGQGQEADCVVGAIAVSHPAGGPPALCRYSIVSVSKALPEGQYELLANGESVVLHLSNGHWLSSN
jgi:hypothetical protein